MTDKKQKKISVLNDELDVKLFLYIAKKNLIFVLLLFAIAISSAYLYLRYTPPLYQASSVIQIASELEKTRILPTAHIYEDDIARKIELLRSSVFLQRALSKLPLEITYYSKGRVLNHELYKSTPFIIEKNVKNSNIYGLPIYVDFLSDSLAVLSYELRNNEHRRIEVKAGEWGELPEFDFKIEILNFKAIEDQQSIFSRNSYFFIINNPANIVSYYAKDIKVNVLNAAAKTIEISYSGNNAGKTSDIVNAIAEEFKIYDLERKAESANNILSYIDLQLELIFDKLTESELELERFKNKYEITEPAHDNLTPMKNRLNELQNQLINLEIERSIYQDIEKNLLESEEIDIYKLVAVLAGIDFQNNISNMMRALHDLLMEREKLLYQVTPRSSQIAALDYQIDIQKRYLVESINSIKSNIELRLADIKSKIEEYNEFLKIEPREYSLVEYSRLQRIYSINEKFYNQLVEKKAEYSISVAGHVPQSTILERSASTGRPISPRPRAIYISGVLASLFLGAGLIFLRYIFYNEIPSLNDILKHTDAPILGVIPKYKSAIPKDQLLVLDKPKSVIAEALRSIRTNLQFIDNSPGSKIIAVTSTISSEGKTFFAVNLAGILAFSNKKVIVIDFDMRKPKIHFGFNVANNNGVSTILSGIDSLEKCIQKSKESNLDFITAGPVPPNPSELILSPKMDELLDELKKTYDYIIIDNPPVGIVTDGMKSIMKANYPIYLFKANFSKRIFIQNVNRLIGENKIPNLAIVLNSVDKQYSSYGYDKGYAYGYYGDYGYEYYDENRNGNTKSFFNLFSKLQFRLKRKS